MEIIVLGAGAIGSLYGAKLAAANDVTLVGRPDHIRAIEENGLRIEGLEPQTVRVRAATRIQQLKPNALILLTTKVSRRLSATTRQSLRFRMVWIATESSAPHFKGAASCCAELVSSARSSSVPERFDTQ